MEDKTDTESTNLLDTVGEIEISSGVTAADPSGTDQVGSLDETTEKGVVSPSIEASFSATTTTTNVTDATAAVQGEQVVIEASSEAVTSHSSPTPLPEELSNGVTAETVLPVTVDAPAITASVTSTRPAPIVSYPNSDEEEEDDQPRLRICTDDHNPGMDESTKATSSSPVAGSELNIESGHSLPVSDST